MSSSSETIASPGKTSGVVLVLGAAVLWSFSGVCVKSMPGVSPLLITGYRSVITFWVMAAYLFFTVGSLSAGWRMARAALRYRRAWGSAICYSLMLVLFISATRYTTAANAILLQYAAPLYVALLSVPMLGEPVRPREWMTLAGCFAGILLFFGEQLSVEGFWGNILGILSGIACGLNAVFMRSLSQEAGKEVAAEAGKPGAEVALSLPAILMGNLLAVAMCLPWMFPPGGIAPKTWGILVFMGVVQLGIPYILFTIGMARLSAVTVVILAMAEAVLNPVWTALGAGEYPSPVAGAGGFLILFSIGLYGYQKNSRSTQKG